MVKDMALIIGGRLIPNPGPGGFRRSDRANETTTETLGSHIYTDFINVRREWVISWDKMTYEDYETILDLYYEQYSDEVYHFMQFDAFNIYAQVKLEITEANLRLNGSIVDGFSMIIKEKFAIS